MFGRSNQDQKPIPQPIAVPQPAAAPAIQPPQPAAAAAPAPIQQSTTQSVIGEDLAIVGQKIAVISQARILVNGMIEGDVSGKDVTIGPKGKVSGTVTGNQVQIEGQVKGAIRGAVVTLAPSARVEGDIFHQKLAIAEGAEFDGRVRRPQNDAEITPNLDPSSYTRSSG